MFRSSKSDDESNSSRKHKTNDNNLANCSGENGDMMKVITFVYFFRSVIVSLVVG